MKNRVLISLAIVGAVASAAVGYSAFGQSSGAPPAPPDCTIYTDPDEQAQCQATQSAPPADGTNPGANTGTPGNITYMDINGWIDVTSDVNGGTVSATAAHVLWLQDCEPCNINIPEQAHNGGSDAHDVLLGMADQSHQSPPTAQCQSVGECQVRLSGGGGCAEDCSNCPDPGDGTPEDCWELDELADGCVKKPGCTQPEDPEDAYPVTEIRQPYLWVWTGGCGDGTYGGMKTDRQRSVGNSNCASISDDGERARCESGIREGGVGQDLFPSITGCYTPEERFVKIVGQEEGEGSLILAPDDARLTLHPRCVAGDVAMETNQTIPMAKFPSNTGGSANNEQEVKTAESDFGSFRPAHLIGCLHNDYIDDFSNFCRQYIMQEDRYLVDKWEMSEAGCWIMVENQPAFTAPIAGEHYLPLAHYTGDGKAVPDGQSYTVRYGNMGQHGFRNYRIYDPRNNPQGVWVPEESEDGKPVMEEAADGENMQETGEWIGRPKINPLDIYNYGTDFVGSMAKDINYRGRKFKLQQCLKQYIEEYAHLGDCGQIVLPGAKPFLSDSHCQWVIMARQEQNKTMLQTLFDIPAVQTILNGVLEVGLGKVAETVGTLTGNESIDASIPDFKRSKRGLRAEYFDYQNFATAGWIPSTPPMFGISPEQSTDVCTKKVTDGMLNKQREQQVFNTAKGLDFARRGCPTVVGPDTWPNFFNMSSCDFTRGALQFGDGVKCNDTEAETGFCLSFDPTSYFYYQTFPPQAFPRNLSLTTNINAGLANIWWSGFRDGLISMGADIAGGNYGSVINSAASALNHMKPMVFNSVPAGNPAFQLPILPPQDYVDPLWVARTCMHDMWAMFALQDPPYVDYWYETADWMPNFLKFPFPAANDVPKCEPRHLGPGGTCCGDECGLGGAFCDCYPDDAINPRKNGEDCGALGAYNEYTWDEWKGQNFRDGNCMDADLPTETVFGFPFFAGEVPDEFKEFQWPSTMDIVNGIITTLPAFKVVNFETIMASLGISPATIQTMKDIGSVIQETAQTMDDINAAVTTTMSAVQIASMAGSALAVLDIIDVTDVTKFASDGAEIGKDVWDAVYTRTRPILNILQPDSIINAVGLGGIDLGCLTDYWATEYGGDGLAHLQDFVKGRTEEKHAQKDPNYQMPEYEDGQGPKKVIPAKCLRNDNPVPNYPVVFSYRPNLMRFQDAQWCEFEVPYIPQIYDYEFTVPDDLIVVPGVYGDDLSYVEAAYNAAVTSVDGITDFLVHPLDDAARNDVKAKNYTSEAYMWFGTLRSIYDPAPPEAAAAGGAGYDVKDEPGFPMVERIRDGCGAFTQRASWTHDRNNGLIRWLFNRNEGRCAGWKGIYGRKYSDLKIVSWRLPRFNYEFLKAFIECTGPVYSRGPNVCSSGINWLKIAKNAMPCVDPGVSQLPCINSSSWSVPITIPGNLRPTNLDDVTGYSQPWNQMGGGLKFGFWCSCPRDNMLTTVCNESFCTCDAYNFNQIPWVATYPGLNCGLQGDAPDCGKMAALSINMCEGYGPFAQWMQCFYNARAKACPVLEREISNGIVGSMHMQTNPNDMRTVSGAFQAMAKQPAEGVNIRDICRAVEPKASYENLRWNAEEPNILAHMPITADYASRDSGPFFNEKKPDYIMHDIGFLKHPDLVFQSAVRDIEAPFMEITLPWPTSLDIPSQSIAMDAFDNQKSKPNDLALFQKASDIANLAWLETRLSDIGGLDGGGRMHQDWPHPRATEVILGPRGCDIGGWYEMMLYQARCIRWFKLNCMCDYRKTFIEGSSEAYVLMRAGIGFPTRLGYEDDGRLRVSQNRMSWPLMWRGFVGPDYAPPPRYIPNAENAIGSSMLMTDITSMSTLQLKDAVEAGTIIDTQDADPVQKRAISRWESAKAGKLYIQTSGVRVCAASEDQEDDDCVRVCNPDTDTPEQAEDCVAEPRPYTIRYGGLEVAEPGDFMIYDEEIPLATGDMAGEDARYPRHVAYVEEVDLDKGIVTVSEMNWGKDLDSCGNTDRWGLVTTRRIFRDDEDINPELLCNNPDWLDCYEPNWYYIKIYRPSLDKNNPDRPICFTEMDKKYPYEGQVMNGEYALQMPEKFEPDSRSMRVQFDDKGKVRVDETTCPPGSNMPLDSCTLIEVPQDLDQDMTAENLVETGAWKRDYYGWYDANEVAAFLKQRRGRCDPPISGTTPDYTVPTLPEQDVDDDLLNSEF